MREGREELAHRLATACTSYFVRVSYPWAEKAYVPKEGEISPFWLSLADLVLENWRRSHPTSAKPQGDVELSLAESIELWKQGGYLLLGYIWINPQNVSDWTVSFNPGTSKELRAEWSKSLGPGFRHGNLLDELKKQ